MSRIEIQHRATAAALTFDVLDASWIQGSSLQHSVRMPAFVLLDAAATGSGRCSLCTLV